MHIKNNLSECHDKIKAATAVEMVLKLNELQDFDMLSHEEYNEYQIFIEAAVNMIVFDIPEFIRPANICGEPRFFY